MENSENSTNTSPLKKEKIFIKNFFMHYFLAIIIFYASLSLFKKGLDEDSTIILMYIFFGTPLLLALIYFVKMLIFLFEKKWESFKFSLLIIVIGILIGGGVCLGNLMMIDL